MSEVRKGRRILRTAVFVAAAFVAAAVAAVLILSLAPARNKILTETIRWADRRIPGSLDVREARWSGLGRLEAGFFSWTDGGDTLLVFDHLRLEADIRALLHREIYIRTIDVKGLRADLPAIRSRVGSGGGKGEKEGGAALPSLRIDSARLDAPFLVVAPGRTILRTRLEGSVRLLPGSAPFARVDRLDAEDGGGAWSVEGGTFLFDPETASPSGSVFLRFGADRALRLLVEGEGEDRFLLTARVEEDSRSDGAALDLRCALERAGGRVAGLRFEGNLDVPEGAVPVRAGARPFPPASLAIRLQGGAALPPAKRARLSGEWTPGAFLRGGGFAVRYDEGTLDLDSLVIRLADAVLSARGTLREGEIDARAEARIRGTEGLAMFGFGEAPGDVENPRADLTVRAEGPVGAPRLTAAAEMSARFRGTLVDTLRFEAEAPEGLRAPVTARLRARALDHGLAFGLSIDLSGDEAEARVTPIALWAVGGSPGDAPGRLGEGTIRRASGGAGYEFENLSLFGEPGEWSVNGRVAREGSGSFRVEWRGGEPPPPLLRAGAKRGPAVVDSVRAAWRREGPFRATIRGEIANEGGSPRVDIAGDLRLPGPRTFAALAPGAEMGDFGPVEGTIRASLSGDAGGRGLDARLDLSATAWLDTALIRVRGEGDRIAIDTARVVLDGFRMDGQGVKESNGWRARARLALTGPDFPRRVLPALPGDLDLSLDAEGELRGGAGSAEGSGSFHGWARTGTIEASRFDGIFLQDAEGLSADLRFAEGLRAGPVRLDTLRASVRLPAAGDSSGAPSLRLSGAGPGVALLASGRMESEDGTVIAADSLDLFIGGGDLRTVRPFRVRIGPERGLFSVDSLEMRGGLGSLNAVGSLRPERSDLALRADLRLPPKPEGLLLSDDLWPGRVLLDWNEDGDGTAEGKLQVEGILYAARSVIAALDLRGDRSGADLRVALTAEADTLFAGEGRLPVAFGPFPPVFGGREDPISFDGRLRGFPVPLSGGRAGEGARTVAVDGTIHLRGSARLPAAGANLRVTFPDDARLASHRLDVAASFGGGAATGDSTSRVSLMESEAADSVPPGDGLQAALLLRDGERDLLRGELALPVTWNPSPPSFDRGAGEMSLKVRSEGLEPSDFNALLPPEIGLSGSCDLRLEMRGDPRDPALDGMFAAHRFGFSRMDGSRVAIDGEARLGGTGLAPSLAGDFELRGGVLRVPEEIRELLPSEGEATLWRIEAEEAATEGPPEPDKPEGGGGQPRAEVAAPARAFDLDVGLLIPSGLWIRGRGLEVELAGELRLLQKGKYPTVVGELSAVRGSLLFLGRAFRVERGTVTFYGEDEADPAMDMVLSANVDGSLIRVLFQGTVHKPVLSLESEPEMSEGDILSFLLFGRSLDQLDHDQMLLVQERAGDMAAFFGAAQIGARLSRDLGVDLVSVESGRGKNGGRSLVIGKYISRRLLLKYEQAIEGRSALYVALEYFLTGRLRVETLFGRHDQSAIGIGWGKDY
ncbi:MAG: translocation/assembly module TamB [Candidatus Eisenbacteria bacterium]|nr:translocation/assembly module TamB [Candidatus Eisenbacteria bacterium]